MRITLHTPDLGGADCLSFDAKAGSFEMRSVDGEQSFTMHIKTRRELLGMRGMFSHALDAWSERVARDEDIRIEATL